MTSKEKQQILRFNKLEPANIFLGGKNDMNVETTKLSSDLVIQYHSVPIAGHTMSRKSCHPTNFVLLDSHFQRRQVCSSFQPFQPPDKKHNEILIVEGKRGEMFSISPHIVEIKRYGGSFVLSMLQPFRVKPR